MSDTAPPLAGVRVVEVATVVAGPSAGRYLADFGAEVVKVEHPRGGDTTRSMGWAEDGVALWWRWIGRNKLPVTLDLSHARGQEIARRLATHADVLIESFRPGTLERWNLGPNRLLEENPRLVVLRVSGFGQDGPAAGKPGFGTLAESMSGLAHMSGDPGGPPMLPPIALADEVAGIAGAFAVMVALWERERSGRGQVVDCSLLESLFQIVGPLPAVHERLGIVPGRSGNRMPYSAPRNVYRTADAKWVGVSGTAPAVAERTFAAIGRGDLARDPRFSTPSARIANVEALDEILGAWIGARTLDEVVRAFDEAGAAAAPVLDAEGIAGDPQHLARGTVVRAGGFPMQGLLARLSRTPGAVRHPGLGLGAANEEIYARLGLTEQDLRDLREDGVV